jgi:SH3 domain-containing YSC84-like protein 1
MGLILFIRSPSAQIMAANDSTIPLNILQQATCVGVVPGLIKGAFLVGAQYGQGVVTCRTGHGWSAPEGLFAGIDLDGTSVSQNSEDTELYYGQPHPFETILKGNVDVPPGAVPFVRDVAQNFVRAKHHE